MFRIKHWVAIVVVGFLTYANILFNPFVLEDRATILRNPSIHSFSNIPNLFINQVGGQESLEYYRPLLFTFYTILYALFHEFTFPYHLVQIAFQIGNALLIFLLFKKFLKSYQALILVLLFLVHPINELSVVWIATLQDVLFVFFGLISLFFLQRKNLTLRSIILSNIAVLLSLFSKETGVLFVLMGFLWIFLYHKKDFWFYTFFTIITGIIYTILRLSSQIPFQKEALVPIMHLTFAERMMQVPLIIFYYLKTLLFPSELVVYHSKIIQSIQFDNFFLPLLVDLVVLILLFGISITLIKRGKDRKMTIFFSIWFVVGFLIHLQIIPLDFTVSDHFFLFPMIGLLGLIGLIFKNLHIKVLNHKFVLVFVVIILGLLWFRTVVRNTNWKDQYTLLSHDEKVSSNDYLLELVYTTELIQKNKLDDSLIHAKRAINLYPYSYLAWSSLGVIYYQKKDYVTARKAFEKSISLGKTFGTYENLGLLILKHDDLSKANQFLRNATGIFPNSKKLWYYRIISEYKSGNYEEALLSSKNYYLLQKDSESYTIYSFLLQNKPIHIEF